MAGQQFIGTGRLGTSQDVVTSAASAAIANAVGSGVTKVRVQLLTSPGRIRIGVNPVAVATDTPMPIDAPEYFTIQQGEKVACIATGAGVMNVTEIV